MAAPGTFSPAPARTLVAAEFLPTPLYGVTLPERLMRWPDKASGDALDFAVDLTGWLADGGGDLAQGLQVAATPSGNPGDLAVVWQAIYGTVVALMLSAGVPGTVYELTLTVGTASGRVLTLRPVIVIAPYAAAADALPPAIPPQSLLLDDGTALQLDSGVGFILAP